MRRSNEQPTVLQQNITMTERFIGDTSSSRSLSLKSHESTCQKTTLLDKIGLLNATILLLGSLCILGDLGFLWLVWAGNEHQAFWRWLILKGYLQRTATLSSVVLRTIIGIQSSVCTSMIAASIMELSTGFDLVNSASLSIQRFSGGLPLFLFKTGIFSGEIWYLFLMTVLISFTSIASHFISTGLVADLEIASIIGDGVLGQAAYSLNFTKVVLLNDYEPDFTTYMPSLYPAFGEYTEPSTNSVGIDDTGPTIRAILPVSSPTTRTTMSNYTGFGTVLNSHVICIKPAVKNITFVGGGGPFQIDPLYLTGSVSVGTSIPPGLIFYNSPGMNNVPNPLNYINFTCSFAKLLQSTSSDWPISMCIAGNAFGSPNITGGGSDGAGRLGILGLRSSSLLNERLGLDQLSYVMLNYSGTLPASYGRKVNTNWTDISSNQSSWLTLKQPSDFAPSLDSISISYCFPNFAAIDVNITISSNSERTEPVLRSGRTPSQALDTSEVLPQLGANGQNLTLARRGILELEYSSAWTDVLPPSDDTAAGSSWVQALPGTYGFGMTLGADVSAPDMTTWALCTNCGVSVQSKDTNTTAISAALSSIFQSSVKASGSTARALQAMLTVVNMMQYYDRLQQFDVMGNTSTTLIEQQLQPVGRTGLIIVTVGLGCHMLIVTIIAVIFLAGTKLSFIGEAWHTIAQLQSQDILPILKDTSLMRDDGVEAWLVDQNFSEDEMVLVGQEGKDGRAGAIIRRKGIGNFF